MSSPKDTLSPSMTIVVDHHNVPNDSGSDTLFLDQTIELNPTFEEDSESSGYISSLAEEMTKDSRERYVVRSLLGVGGFALVHQVSDVKIGRDIAVKRLNPHASEMMKHNFLLEARVMSQLDHPGMLPIYDFIEEGEDSGEMTFAYSMRIATHKSLYDDLQKQSRQDYHRVCHILRQVALTLEHAHQRGILHRDLKPQNILLGSEGEVYLTDWGVCTLLSSHPDYRFLSETMKSLWVGTPAYMAPEQVIGVHERLTPLTDVYGLGATLYHALSNTPLHAGLELSAVLEEVRDGRVISPSDVWKARGEAFPYPHLLESICLKALSFDPKDRYQSARELADELERFTNGELERERARESAQVAYRLGQEHLTHFFTCFNRHSLLIQGVEDARSHYKKSRTAEHRSTLWALEDQLDDLLNPMEESFAHAISAFQSALRDQPHHHDAKTSITRLYKARYQQALETNDQRMMIFFEERIKEYASASELLEFEKPSEIRITCLPKGATVRVFASQLKRYSNELTEEQVIENYTDEVIFLTRGRYVITCIHAEASEARIVLWIQKYQQREIHSPLPKRSSIPHGFVYVKDRLAFGQYPVTISNYCDFLNDLNPQQADEHIPRYYQTAYCERSDNGQFEVPYTDVEGDVWQPDWPVFLVSYHDAIAYAEWLSRQMSAHVRIPSEEEWLDAASGGDGRPYPWGMSFDASLCIMRESHEGRPVPVSVKTRETDCSPYGVYCVSGTICQWVSTHADGEIDARKRILGASYNSMELMCHLQQKMKGRANETLAHVGIRVLIELNDEDLLPHI